MQPPLKPDSSDKGTGTKFCGGFKFQVPMGTKVYLKIKNQILLLGSLDISYFFTSCIYTLNHEFLCSIKCLPFFLTSLSP